MRGQEKFTENLGLDPRFELERWNQKVVDILISHFLCGSRRLLSDMKPYDVIKKYKGTANNELE